MAEQTFRSPGFFEREVDLTQREVAIEGVPAGIIGTSLLGPAFVPVTLGSFTDFERKFGTIKRDFYGPFAVREWLKNRSSVTFVRVLGAGAVGLDADTAGNDLETTLSLGTVKHAGFRIKGTVNPASSEGGVSPRDSKHQGSVQFLVAAHEVNSSEILGYPIFTDNDSFNTATDTNLVRAMILTATGSRLQIIDHSGSYADELAHFQGSDAANIKNYDGSDNEGTFKLVLSSGLGSTFGNDENYPGVKIYTASLNPESKYYISKFLNTDPDLFQEKQHLLYADFPVEHGLAKVKYHATNRTVAIASGSANTSSTSGDTALTFRDAFGRFDTRYKTARTTSFISQPFGSKEYDLFHFESLDDGEVGNTRVKISIADLKRSTNPKDKYGTFSVLVRDYNDTDTNLKVLEQFSQCSLNPASENYIANKIGDLKVCFNFDADTESERRLISEGRFGNKSKYVRIIMNANVSDKLIPEETLPFGFRGLPVPKTNDSETDAGTNRSTDSRLGMFASGSGATNSLPLTGSIVPPVPFRYKVTRGAAASTQGFAGDPGLLEIADSRYFWGVKLETIPRTTTITNAALQPNASSEKNSLLKSYSKLLGLPKLDTVMTGSGADNFCNNKFTLSRVALHNQISLASSIEDTIASIITGSADEHMKETVYIRNGKLETKNYTILDDVGSHQRATFSSLLTARSEKYFNRFSKYAKFTNIFYGGFDGVNILDKDNRLLNDIASSVEAGGKANVANGTYTHQNLHADSNAGSGKENNIINSYRVAAQIITDPFASRVNVIAVPGIKEPFVTDFISEKAREYSQAIYLMDIPSYDDNGVRIYNTTTLPNVQSTIDEFSSRGIDNNYVASYFPDVDINDDINNIIQSVPSSVAAIKALSYNDSVSYPWFAPAGFNRGALNNVINSRVRLNTEDRNILYEARLNPIANFPNSGFVIFGQKTLQQNRSALDRVNVRRMLLEVKRIVSEAANKLIFENNTPQTRARFISQVTPSLGAIQAQQGIDQFKIIMDSSNNTEADVEQNRLNGRIIVVPTRAIEFIAVDFIITNSGVSFE